MKKTKVLLASLVLGTSAWAQTALPPFVMTTPNEYRIIAASPNGKWACGVYADYGDERYGFLWNLESGEIELLNPSNPSLAYSVSNDGVVVGVFADNTFRSNGASVNLAGYWANHKWNRLEMPDNSVTAAGASSISPDGHYITGHIEKDGAYLGYVWKDGKIYYALQAKNNISMPYAISPDGQMAAGWVQDDNRMACFWNADGSYTALSGYESPWSSGRMFSPDGKSLLYYGGWEEVDGQWGVGAIYNIATGNKTVVMPKDDEANFDFFDISDKGTVVGENGDRAFIWQNSEPYYAEDYLKERGINLGDYHVFVDPDASDYYQLTRTSSVSADDNVMGFQYYNDDKDEDGNYSISMQSMVVKFNQVRTGLCPVSIGAKQLSGLSDVKVSWLPNVAAEGITGYNVYRDGVKVNTALVDADVYVDKNVANGEHKYTVTAVYGTAESAKSVEASVNVATKGLSVPDGLFAQQHSYNSAYLEWNAPYTNYSSLNYFDANDANVQTWGLGVADLSYETAIRFDKEELDAYAGQKITSVGFYPMEQQGGWKINLYTYDASGALKRFYTQNVTQQLNYGTRNVVALDTPQDLPQGDLLVALEVAVNKESSSINAYDYGRAKDGYTDLLRLTSEPDFYSLGQLFQSQNYLNEATWIIDATLAPASADLNKDAVKNYNVYADGKLMATPTTLSCLLPSLSEGEHSLGVSAVYNDGSESDVNTTALNIVNDESQLKPVQVVSIESTSPSAINASWEKPSTHDYVDLQYSYGDAAESSIKGPQSNNYNLMAGAIYPAKTFRGRDGYQITKARFYPLSDASFTVMVYKNDQLISSTDVYDYTVGKWNEVTLDAPIEVDSKSTYQLVIDCYDVTPNTAPIAIDKNNPVGGYSDIYSLDGSSWNPMSTSGMYGNWMIGLVLENTSVEDLAIKGYDVALDGVKKNASLLTTNSFAYDFGKADSDEHTVKIDVYYDVKPECVAGNVVRFNLGVSSGINEGRVDCIKIQKGKNELTVSGDNVSAVEVVSVDGATVASAQGNTVSIDGIAAGVYVVKVKADGKTTTRKIVIEK